MHVEKYLFKTVIPWLHSVYVFSLSAPQPINLHILSGSVCDSGSNSAGLQFDVHLQSNSSSNVALHPIESLFSFRILNTISCAVLLPVKHTYI